ICSRSSSINSLVNSLPQTRTTQLILGRVAAGVQHRVLWDTLNLPGRDDAGLGTGARARQSGLAAG
ncbi:MAG: hypothetical protein AB7O66_22835, partial [Limisphaerales bacterium]